MSTTLEQELEQAAYRADGRAATCREHGMLDWCRKHEAEAARLRARAAHVRRMLEDAYADVAAWPEAGSRFYLRMASLTGPDISQSQEGEEK